MHHSHHHHHHVYNHHHQRHQHHYWFRRTHVIPTKPLTYEEQVKAAKASIVMGIFVLLFAIGAMTGLIYLVLSFSYLPPLLLIPFILFPTIIIAVSVIQMVRSIRFLRSEPPQEQESPSEECERYPKS